MKAIVRVMTVLALALLISVPFFAILKPAAAEEFSIIGISVDHPTYAGTYAIVPITIVANGGPAADLGGNYTLTNIAISATNNTGFDWSPKSPVSEDGVFKINLTMPGEADQTIKLTVNVTSKSTIETNQTYATFSFTIKVVEPILIRATVWNYGDIEAANVTARFYADGAIIYIVEFNVSAGASKTLNYNWTFASIKRGEHTVSVTIDDPSNVVEFSEGNNVWTQTIIVGNQGNPVGAVLAMVLIIIIVLFVLTYLQKPVKRTKKF